MENNRSKTYLIIFAVFFVIAVSIIVLIVLANKQPPRQYETPPLFPTAAPLLYKNETVVSVDPSYKSVLRPGNNQIFTVRLSQPILNNSLKILLTKAKPSQSEQISSVLISSTFKDQGKTLVISMQEPVEIHYEYSLVIIDQNNRTLLSTTYLTSNVEITVIQKNNLELKQYLPHETTNYKLSYNEMRNEYIFNFKVDPKSPTGFNDQYNQAKTAAEEFIKSKGIDINSIVIDWRHS